MFWYGGQHRGADFRGIPEKRGHKGNLGSFKSFRIRAVTDNGNFEGTGNEAGKNRGEMSRERG